MTKLLSDISELTVYWELPRSRHNQFTDSDINSLIDENSWFTEICRNNKIRIWFVKPEDMAIVKVALAHLDKSDASDEDDIISSIRSRFRKSS